MLALVGALLLSTHMTRACTIPVYEYALVNWPADIYRVTVFHSEPFSEKDHAVVTWLQEASYTYDLAANYLLEVVDVSQELSADKQAVWDSLESPELPFLVVQYPQIADYQGIVWSGCLCLESAQMIVDSPARREIAKRQLNDGNAAVWVLLESGDATEDAAAETFIAEQLALLNATLAEEKDEFDAEKAAFSLFRISRSDPQEEVFIKMLMYCEPGLFEFARYPMVFPVFGRGRALYAIAGGGITDRNIALAADFITGFCSCQVKEENPGTDLLMVVDWEAGIKEGVSAEEESVPLVGSSTLISLSEDTESSGQTVPDGPEDVSTEVKASHPVVRNMLITFGSLAAVVIVGTLVISMKPQGNSTHSRKKGDDV
jgi:hypothetical protein